MRYTLVVMATDQLEAEQWFADHVDAEVINLTDVKASAFRGDWIITADVTKPAEFTGYDKPAFEGSLNYEMRDPLSDLRFWAVSPARS